MVSTEVESFKILFCQLRTFAQSAARGRGPNQARNWTQIMLFNHPKLGKIVTILPPSATTSQLPSVLLTMATMRPIVFYAHHAGPNPQKGSYGSGELKVPYKVKLLEFPEMKQAAWKKINPNG
ncbi:uncharacterized protein P174DRAFT_496438 [Aspergillus novofumigatus IBT 16806]|uniref:Uncharacterized protein n=1 Tax=Aspergillus novofumigatus (strain IBT 16806) TaxID=1392255 RepID=A0A2I1BXM8_ASPN1|nr:uncharacterized protein P174DRAFT_496438 [Aspergillus novofumigatus IBT 16806]PKX90109.1 hypothetical protein P174DRAFT_496438 [Aspergillus novofumigatus IBT 16806]